MAHIARGRALAINGGTTDKPNEQWVHLVPNGTFHGRDGRGPWTLKDANAVIQASRARAGTTQLPVDYDHQSDFAATAKVGGTAPAAGWIKGLQSRADGIWGLVDWTERATAHLASREYRYISPVFTFDPQTGAVKSLMRAGLTNNPNLDLTAVASAGDIMDDQLTELRELLGLPPDATIDDITAAVRDLLTTEQSAQPDLSRFVPIGDFERVTTELNKLNKGVSIQSAEITVADQIGRGRLPPFLKEWAVSLCSVNKPAFDAFVERTGAGMSSLFREKVSGMPPHAALASVGPDEANVLRNLGLSADDAQKFGRNK